MKDFGGKRVVITGAGSGIGRETMLAFARAGADVIGADIDGPSVTRTADLARLAGAAGASAHVVDVSDSAAMERFAAVVGAPDIVVNNAGIAVSGPFLEHSVRDWERVLGVNVWGVVHGCRLFGKAMVDAGIKGHIVNIASAAAFQPSVTLPAYATSKAAVLMLSECLRAELAPRGIGVSAICPGIIDTPITKNARYVGQAVDEEAKRAKAIRLYRRRNFTPDRVAAEILRAVRNNVAVVPVTVEAKLMRGLSRLSPGAMRTLARFDPLK
jgi:NAD(P)-dependent dehydrogenase (short-subunit alcohol dehydrogenase family)